MILLALIRATILGANLVLWRVEKAAAGIASPATDQGGHDDRSS